MSVIYMMIGVSGCGKSTVARKLNALSEGKVLIVSSDDIREEIYGDASVQTNPQRVFSIAYDRIKNALINGDDVAFDATNLTKKTRSFLFSFLKKNKLDKVSVVACPIEVNVEECIARQNRRMRKVPEAVIRKQAAQYEEPTLEEGFYAIAHFVEKEG